jgi:hypothetical protein
MKTANNILIEKRAKAKLGGGKMRMKKQHGQMQKLQLWEQWELLKLFLNLKLQLQKTKRKNE